MKKEKNYKAYIAGTKESKAFDSAFGQTEKNAIAAIKRRNSPSWTDCCVWCVYVHAHADGQEEKTY